MIEMFDSDKINVIYALAPIITVCATFHKEIYVMPTYPKIISDLTSVQYAEESFKES